MDVFIGSLMLVPYDFVPRDFAPCDGRLLPIQQYTALFSLLGNMYGGDGKINFALPDLRGRVPVSCGQGPGLRNYPQAHAGGVESVTLTEAQMPAHSHALMAAAVRPDQTSATGHVLAMASSMVYKQQPATPNAQMSQTAIEPVGGGTPHSNVMPYQAMTWVIALQGIYPQRP